MSHHATPKVPWPTYKTCEDCGRKADYVLDGRYYCKPHGEKRVKRQILDLEESKKGMGRGV